MQPVGTGGGGLPGYPLWPQPAREWLNNLPWANQSAWMVRNTPLMYYPDEAERLGVGTLASYWGNNNVMYTAPYTGSAASPSSYLAGSPQGWAGTAAHEATHRLLWSQYPPYGDMGRPPEWEQTWAAVKPWVQQYEAASPGLTQYLERAGPREVLPWAVGLAQGNPAKLPSTLLPWYGGMWDKNKPYQEPPPWPE